MTGTVDAALAQRLSELARSLEHEADLQDTLDGIVHAAVGTVPGVEHVSISAIRQRREVETRAATGDLPRALDQAQYDAGEGPCLHTLYEQQTVTIPDAAAERRWPGFTARAAGLGIGSMLAVQLFVEGEDLGALNLSSSATGAFDDESERVALLFASHAAVAMVGAQQQHRLREAIGSRDLIGQAKGILMERFKITGDQAFRLLVKASQDRNRKLAEIAGDLVRTGDLRGSG